MKIKLDFYKKNKINTHINLINRRFYNGTILEVGSNFFVVKDRMIGEVLVIFDEIANIEPFNQGGKGDEK